MSTFVNKNFWPIFVGILALGAVLRLIGINTESLRLDEAQSIWQASHSFSFIIEYMLKNVHLPLHNSLLHVWMILFGSSEVAVRMLAIIPGILFLPALYALAREFLNQKWSLITMFFGAVSPFFIWYSREIRMYSLLTLITTLSYLFFLRILRSNHRFDYLFYFIINLIGIYTHYFFLLVLFTQAVFYILEWTRKWEIKNGLIIPDHLEPKKVKQFAYLSLVAFLLLLCFSPWLYGLYTTYGSGSLAPIFQAPTSFNLILSLFEFLFGFQPVTITGLLISLWPLFALFSFILLQKEKRSWPTETWLILLGILLPMIIVFGVSITLKPMYLTRYLTIVAPFTYILLALFIKGLPGKKEYYLTIVGGLFLIMLTSQQFHPASPVKEDYRDAVKFLETEATPRDIIVLAPPYLIYPFQYYYGGQAKITSLPIWDKRKGAIPMTTPELLARDAAIIKGNHQRIMLLEALDLIGAKEARDYFDKNLTKLDKKQFSENLWVHIYQAEYSE